MKLPHLKAAWPGKASILAFYLKLMLGLGIGLALSSSTILSPTTSAQTDTGLFPGQLVVEGTWPTAAAGHELIKLDDDRILEWEPASGQFRIWGFDLTTTGTTAPFLKGPIVEGTWDKIGPGQQLVYLGGNRILSWEPASGRYQVWQYEPTITGRADPTRGPMVEGTWPTIRSGHQLIYLGSNIVLDWEPASGRYRLWRDDPFATGRQNPFSPNPVAAGVWDTVTAGHELIYLGVHRLLDWEPASGRYRIWRYEPPIRPNMDPFPGNPVAAGAWSAIGSGHQLIYLGRNSLLDWEPASGHYRVWQYELAAVAAFSLEDIAAKLSQQTVTGLTVVTHGFQIFNNGGDSLSPLAEAIHQKAGGWLLDYDVPDDEADGFFDTCTNDCDDPAPGPAGAHELVLLFDWAPESNELNAGWGEAAGDALFNMLIGLGLVDPQASTHRPLHLIAHSFGTAVTGELVERLARFGISVDHLTYLDPHDFDQELQVDGAQRLFDLGKPPGYGTAVWDNVIFADAYYQTRGLAGSLIPPLPPPLNRLPPNGRPIPGAYNKLLETELPADNPAPYAADDLSGDHSYVWGCFYLATVTGSLPVGCPPPQIPIDFSQTGYVYSRIAGGLADRPQPVFYSSNQDHKYSEPILVGPSSGQPNLDGLASLGLTPQDVTQGRWQPAWNPLAIVNGNFENLNDNETLHPVCAPTNTCPQPGWSHHGGGGKGHFEQDHTNYLVLDGGEPIFANNEIHTHNWFYIPPQATHLQFHLQRNLVTSADQLELLLGNQSLITYQLNQDDSDFFTQRVIIPQDLAGRMTTLTFRIVRGGTFIGSEAWIDNVSFLTSTYLPVITRNNPNPGGVLISNE